MSDVRIAFTGEDKNIQAAFGRVKAGIKGVTKTASEEGNKLDSVMDSLGKKIGALGASFAAAEFVKKIAMVRGEFQKLEVAFNTMLGSKAESDKLMSQLIQTAATTPFGMTDVANGAKQLLAFGFSAAEVNDTLVRLGDIAAGLSLPLNDLVYLYGTTMTQGRLFTQDLKQFMGRGIPLADELAKQFGVTKDKVGDLVTAGKVGFPEVQKAIVSMTSEGGKFGGLMEEQSKTIAGKISNLEDAIEQMYNNIGKQTEGIIASTLDSANAIVENYEGVGRVLMSLVSTYGAYKAAVIATAAIERVRILGMKDAIAYTWLNITATKTATAVQSAFNAVCALNPWALAAVAVVALGTAVWALSDHTSDAEKATERHNKQEEERARILKEEKEEAEALRNVILDESKTEGERQSALEKLKNLMPGVFNDYKTYTDYVNNSTDAIKKETEAIYERERALKRESYNKDKYYLNAIEKYRKDAEDLEGGKITKEEYNRRNSFGELREAYRKYHKEITGKELKGNIASGNVLDWAAEMESVLRLNISKSAEEMRSAASAEWTASLATKSKEQLQKEKKLMEQWIKKAKANGKEYIQIKGDIYPTAISEIERRIADASARIDELTKNEGVDFVKQAQDAVIKAEENLRKIKSDSKNREKYPTAEVYEKALANAKSELEAAQKTLKDRQTGLESKDKKKTQSKAQSNQAVKELLKDQKNERLAQEKEDYFQLAQQSIDLETDLAEKKLKQIKLNHEKELWALDQQKEQEIKAEIERQKAVFNAKEAQKKSQNDNYVEKIFTEEDIDISVINIITEKYKQLRENLKSIHAKSLAETAEEETRAMDEYYKTYGTYLQKIEAITRLYAERIKKATTEGERLTLEKQRDEEIKGVRDEMGNSGINWDLIFADTSHRSIEALKEMRTEIRNVILTNKELSMTDMSKLYEQYNKVGVAIEDASFSFKKLVGFTNDEIEHSKRLKEEAEETKRIYEELVKLKSQQEVAAKSNKSALVSWMKDRGLSVTGDESKETMTSMLQGANASSEDMTTFEHLFQNNKDASNALSNTTDKIKIAGDAMTVASEAASSVGSGAAGTIAMIDKIIHTINDNVQSMIGLNEELGISDTKFGQFTEKFAESSQYATDAWESLKSGNFIGVAQGVLGSLRTLGEGLGELGINGFGAKHADLPRKIEELALSNKSLMTSIDNLSEEIERTNNLDAVEKNELAQKNLADAIKGSQKILHDAAENYNNGFLGIGGQHSAGHYISEALNKADWDRISSILNEGGYELPIRYSKNPPTMNGLKDVGVKAEGYDLFSLSPEAMKYLMTYAPDLWSKITLAAQEGYSGAELVEELENYIEYAGQAEELTEQINEKLTDTSFDSLRDEFKNALTDMNVSAEDFNESFGKMIVNALAESLMTEKYDEKIRQLYSKWADYMQDGELSETELSYLKQEKDAIYNELEKDKESLNKFSNENDLSQETTKTGIATASQESVDELNGRFTAIQISNDNIDRQMTASIEQMTTMTVLASSRNTILSDIREQSVLANSYLYDIARYAKFLTEVNEKMSQVVTNTGRI